MHKYQLLSSCGCRFNGAEAAFTWNRKGRLDQRSNCSSSSSSSSNSSNSNSNNRRAMQRPPPLWRDATMAMNELVDCTFRATPNQSSEDSPQLTSG
ncbi:hypothetical protein M0802_000417 [Mischocyttarus mexicanus]|nr:hypothetical protein M0802_000417 [Mischocyttarus mexicanus]